MLKAAVPILWSPMQRANSLEKTLMLGKIESKRRSGLQSRKWLDSITDSGHEHEQTPGDSGGQKGLVCCSPRGHRELGHNFVNEKQQISAAILFEVASYIICHLLLLAFPTHFILGMPPVQCKAGFDFEHQSEMF